MDVKLQLAQRAFVCSSEKAAAALAENYVGLEHTCTIVPLRIVAIASNVAFISYALRERHPDVTWVTVT